MSDTPRTDAWQDLDWFECKDMKQPDYMRAMKVYTHCRELERDLAAATERAEKADAECERLRKDAERLDWISVPGRFVEGQGRDRFMSMFFERKCVTYYINGVFRVVNGDTLRAAIDTAIAASKEAT